MKLRTIYAALFGIVGGLLGAGVIWVVASQPRGQPVTLRPPPTAAPILIHVDGAVASPGVYPLPEGSRIREAIEAAGGFASTADPAGINLAMKLADGDMLWIPDLSADTLAPRQTGLAQGAGNTPDGGNRPQSANSLIEINKATQEELESLPGIGPATALKIISYREEHGPFTTIDEITRVSGIGPATFEEIKNLITVFTGINPR
ncbi:MAG: helix-hairpin-helix domain-containing protein [Anaerolineales bacterium]|nr:helix-hairpin-helix domain-containing protein [Anaerolineales bacterium]